jgi:hypothetical protein
VAKNVLGVGEAHLLAVVVGFNAGDGKHIGIVAQAVLVAP